jgi:chromosome partitioning protein
MKGLERIINTLDMVMKSRKDELPCSIVPTMYDARTRASRETLEMLQASYPDQIWSGFIPVDTQFREASRQQTPLTLMNPKSRGALAYRKLLHSLLKAEVEKQNLQMAKAS